MLHGPHIVLGDGIGDVANEEVLNRMAIRQQRRSFYRVITNHEQTIVLSHTNVKFRVITHRLDVFVLSHTNGKLRAFTHRSRLFVLSPTNFRVFTHRLSCFHTPDVSNSSLSS